MKAEDEKKPPWLLMFSAVDYRRKKVEQDIISDLEEIAMNIEQVREALIEWEKLSANKENQAIFEARAKELRDLLSNLEGERRQGKQEGKRETAIEMLKESLMIELIEKVTKLSRKEIEELKNQL